MQPANARRRSNIISVIDRGFIRISYL